MLQNAKVGQLVTLLLQSAAQNILQCWLLWGVLLG
jgi:hypothetical protein